MHDTLHDSNPLLGAAYASGDDAIIEEVQNNATF